MIGIVIL